MSAKSSSLRLYHFFANQVCYTDHATFEYYFVPGPTNVPVFAGLIPLDNLVLGAVPTATLCLYVEGFTSSLLTNNKYATSFPIDGCDTGCRSLVLPGGIELARLVSPWLNQSMFEGGLLDNAETIRINNAPGIVTTYRNISDIDRNWTTAPLKWATVMATYKQYATTAYNRQNFSIIDVRPTASLEQMSINALDYKTIFEKIMIPTSPINETDRAGIESLVYSLTWLHRTYIGSFPDDQNSLVTNLHNLLAIPL